MSAVVITAAALVQIAAACPVQGVPIARMVKTAEVESGFTTTSINDNTDRRSYAPASVEDAIALARQLIAAKHSIDAGVMQINTVNWQRLRLTVDTVFDPRANICAAQEFLAGLYDVERRVSCRYNTGQAACGNGYPEKIAAATPAPLPAPPAPSGPTWDVWGQSKQPQEREASPAPDAPKPPVKAPDADPTGVRPVALQAIEIE
ncbi:MAG: Lytic transglycosylase, catalytic [Rhodoferax sp.]|nr:Lytic transglycosylase, catalytic [Rhodoferax sp.]